MNALAKDQEKRFAETILETPELKGAGLTVGLYTGRYDPENPGASRDSGAFVMGKSDNGQYHGISNQPTLQENPPDILLTNYKMLDFLADS